MTLGPDNWLHCLRGRFIVLDGPDGCGKSTQFRLMARFVQEAGLSVCEVREPGGTEMGEEIRKLLLDPNRKEEVDLRCEMLLFMASRAQLVAQRLRPALAQGCLLLADRFISSTFAYQGTAGGLPLEEIRAVGQVALGDCWPDLVVIFDVDEQTAAQRMAGSAKRKLHAQAEQATLFSDRMELRGSEFQRAVRRGYLEQAAADPEHYLVIDASAGPDEVFEQLLHELEARLAPAPQLKGKTR